MSPINQTPFVLNLPFWRQWHTARNRFQPWTQKALADYTATSPKVISNLESGAKAHIEPELALRLNDAFSFNMMESERVLKATTLSQLPMLEHAAGHELNYDILPPSSYFNLVWQKFAREYAPAILHDELYDLLGVNRLVMDFHGVDEETLLRVRDVDGANFLHFVFHPGSPLFATKQEVWEQFALLNLYQFRYFSLLLRYTERCQQIFAYLDTLPRFRALWNQALGTYREPGVYQKPYTYRHSLHKDICYTVDSLPEHTPYGYLYVAKISPQNSATEDAVKRMRAEGQPGVLELMPWVRAQSEAADGLLAGLPLAASISAQLAQNGVFSLN